MPAISTEFPHSILDADGLQLIVMVRGDNKLCRACGYPLTPEHRLSARFREGVSCERCFDVTSEADKARHAERHRQIELASRRGKSEPIGEAER